MWWPAEHLAELVLMVADGLSGAQIADELNTRFRTTYTRNAVIGKAHRKGLVTRGVSRRKTTNPPGFREKTAAALAAPAPKPYRVPRPVPPLEQRKLACAAIVPKRLTLEQLESSHCRWPYGDGPFTFCGHPRTELLPYCLDHWHLSRGGIPSHAV
jgi:GcrA cell cycle regulator